MTISHPRHQRTCSTFYLKKASKTAATLAPQIRSQHALRKMLVLRHFKALCCFGVFLGGLSFLLAIVAIATDPWFVTRLPMTAPTTTTDENDVIVEEFENIDENTTAFTNIDMNYTTTMTTNLSEVLTTTDVIEASTTGQTKSGLWRICHQDENAQWTCVKSLQKIEMLNPTRLTFFQSLVAFELISTIATLTGCLVALAAMVQEQPLAVLVAGFTMFFSGMFMLVGHLMMIWQHQYETRIDDVDWSYGYSFKLAWTSFVLCLCSGIIDFIVYRYFRKITEEMMLGTVPAPSAKYVTRTSPVA